MIIIWHLGNVLYIITFIRSKLSRIDAIPCGNLIDIPSTIIATICHSLVCVTVRRPPWCMMMMTWTTAKRMSWWSTRVMSTTGAFLLLHTHHVRNNTLSHLKFGNGITLILHRHSLFRGHPMGAP